MSETNLHHCRRRRRIALLSLATSIALSACASIDVPRNTAFDGNTPEQWVAVPASGDAFASTEWWRDFGDPIIAETVEEAVGANPQVWQAEAVAAQTRAAAVIAGADQLPNASFGTDAGATRQGAGSSGFTTTESYGVNLGVSWEIDLWGRLAAQSAAAQERYLSSTDALRGIRQSIAAQTAKAYTTVVESRQQVALSERTLEVLSETARQVGNRADVGVGSPSDKFLAITNRDSAAAGLALNQEALERALRQLELLLGQYPDGTVRTASQLVNVPPLPPLGIPADLLARRPDIAAAERELRATGFDIVAARRALLPSISLTGSAGTASSDLGNILNGNFSFWSLAGNLIQPVFQGGRLAANVDLSDAVQRNAANTYVLAALNAFTEVESALAARQRIEQRRAALCDGAEAARSAEEIAFNRYRQGVEPFLTVLESQQSALSASSDCLSAGRAALDNHIDLMLALGGGFEVQPVPIEGAGEMTGKAFKIIGEEAEAAFTSQ